MPNSDTSVPVVNADITKSHLLHVFGDRVLAQKLGALAHVEGIGVLEKTVLKMLLVHAQCRTARHRLVLIQTELN